jgi:hypothetical protein
MFFTNIAFLVPILGHNAVERGCTPSEQLKERGDISHHGPSVTHPRAPLRVKGVGGPYYLKTKYNYNDGTLTVQYTTCYLYVSYSPIKRQCAPFRAEAMERATCARGVDPWQRADYDGI